jgi:hypothetical protein
MALARQMVVTIKIGHPRDLPRLRNIFAKIVLLRESVGVNHPRRLPLAAIDNDVRWLVRESSVQMRGYPNVPATDEHRMRRAMITQPGAGGFPDETLVSFGFFRRNPSSKFS